MFAAMRRARMTVGRRIYALICLSFIGLLGVTFLESRELASSLDLQKQIELRHLGDLALGIVKEEHAAVQKGGVSEADAQKRAMARIGTLRYGNNDYFWINDLHPKMVMHPIKPEMNGNDLSSYKDPNGKLLFVDFAETVNQAGNERQRSVELRIRTASCCSSISPRRSKRAAQASFPMSGPSPASTSRSRNCRMWSASRRGTGSSAPASTSTT